MSLRLLPLTNGRYQRRPLSLFPSLLDHNRVWNTFTPHVRRTGQAYVVRREGCRIDGLVERDVNVVERRVDHLGRRERRDHQALGEQRPRLGSRDDGPLAFHRRQPARRAEQTAGREA